MQYWETIKSWVGDGFGAFVYIAIVVLFFIGIIKCIMPIIESKRLLRRASKQICKGDKAKRSWQDDRFLGRGALMPHWSEYLNNLFFADGEYHNASNVEDYINEDTAIAGPGRSTLAEAIPGILVSLGFLGTLLGLSTALSGMNTEIDRLTQSVSTLLDSMKYAFLTSIFGVIGSITFTLLTRIVNGVAKRALSEFYNAMSRYAGVLAVDPMTQVAIYQQEQTAILKTVTNLLSTDTFSATLSNSMATAMQPFSESMSKFVNAVTDKQLQLIDAIVDTYIDRMNQAVHGQFDHLSASMNTLCQDQAKMSKALSEATQAFIAVSRESRSLEQQTENILGKLDAYVNRLAKMQGKSDAGASKLAELIEDIQAVSLKQSEAIKNLSGINAELKKQIDNQMQATKAYADQCDALADVAQQTIQSAAQELTRSSSAMYTANKTARAQFETDMQESLQYFESCMTDFFKNMEWSLDAMRASVRELPEAVEQTSTDYLNQLDTLTKTMARAQRALEGGYRA